MPRRKAVLRIVSSGFCSTFLGSTLLFASGIPYATAPYFAENVVGGDVSLPPLPDALRPMGPPKAVPLPRSVPIVAPLPDPDSPTGQPKAKDKDKDKEKDVAANAASDGDTSAPAAAPPAEEKSVTVSPFNAWIEGDKDAENIARAERAQYQSRNQPQSQGSVSYDADGGTPGGDPDLMLNIRYPYTWNQQPPPNASAVIYTMPKR